MFYLFGRIGFASLTVSVQLLLRRIVGQVVAFRVAADGHFPDGLDNRWRIFFTDDIRLAALDGQSEIGVILVRFVIDDQQFRLVGTQLDALDDLLTTPQKQMRFR